MILGIDRTEWKNRAAAIDSDGGMVTYGEINALAETLKAQIKQRSVVTVLSRNNIGAIAWIIGLIASGNVPLILSEKTEPRLLENLINTYKPQYICGSQDSCNYNNILESGYNYSLFSTGNPMYTLHPELSHLLPTSGSTGSPKLVRHKYQNIEAAAENISTFFKLTEADRPLMVLPIHYTMGLSIVFSHLSVGATVLITGLPMTDAGFWKFLKASDATSFTGVPYSYEILDRMRFIRMKLPNLKLLTQGGGKMPSELNLKFAKYCRDTGKEWIATYGMSEGTARMAWLPPEYAISKAGSIGIAVPNGKLSLRDDNGKEIEESPAEGELCYEGLNVTMGYSECREDLAKGDERNGLLITGDMARRDIDGFYYITGRKGRFLKIFGNRIGLDECEYIIKRTINGEAVCTGTDQKLIVYVTNENESDRARNALIDATHLPATVIEVKCIGRIPKNEAGKIIYNQLSDK